MGRRIRRITGVFAAGVPVYNCPNAGTMSSRLNWIFGGSAKTDPNRQLWMGCSERRNLLVRRDVSNLPPLSGHQFLGGSGFTLQQNGGIGWRPAFDMGKQIERVTPGSMSAFTSYEWRGNVRELQNFIERSVILSDGTVLCPLAKLKHPADAESPEATTLQEPERDHILKILQQTRWVVLVRLLFLQQIRRLACELRPTAASHFVEQRSRIRAFGNAKRFLTITACRFSGVEAHENRNREIVVRVLRRKKGSAQVATGERGARGFEKSQLIFDLLPRCHQISRGGIGPRQAVEVRRGLRAIRFRRPQFECLLVVAPGARRIAVLRFEIAEMQPGAGFGIAVSNVFRGINGRLKILRR